MRKGEHILKFPHVGHFCTNNGRGCCDSIELEVNTWIYKRPFLFKILFQVNFIKKVVNWALPIYAFKIRAIDYFDFAGNF